MQEVTSICNEQEKKALLAGIYLLKVNNKNIDVVLISSEVFHLELVTQNSESWIVFPNI